MWAQYYRLSASRATYLLEAEIESAFAAHLEENLHTSIGTVSSLSRRPPAILSYLRPRRQGGSRSYEWAGERAGRDTKTHGGPKGKPQLATEHKSLAAAGLDARIVKIFNEIRQILQPAEIH